MRKIIALIFCIVLTSQVLAMGECLKISNKTPLDLIATYNDKNLNAKINSNSEGAICYSDVETICRHTWPCEIYIGLKGHPYPNIGYIKVNVDTIRDHSIKLLSLVSTIEDLFIITNKNNLINIAKIEKK